MKKYKFSRKSTLVVSMMFCFLMVGCGTVASNTSETTKSDLVEIKSEILKEESKETTENKELDESIEMDNSSAENDTTAVVSDEYQAILQAYYTAISENKGAGWYMEKDMNYLVAEEFIGNALDNVGYGIIDLDGDGSDELIIGTTENVTDEFYQKMILVIYSGERKVFSSIERDRIYYAGDNRFASLGSGGADYSFNTTLKFEGGEMVDMTYTTEPSGYKQLELIPFSNMSEEG